MKDDPIPAEHHVTRLCTKTRLNDELTWPLATAFMLKTPTEEYLSVNWIEFFRELSEVEAVGRIQVALAGKMSVQPSNRLAVLRVGDLIESVRNATHEDVTPRVLHRPDEPKPDESHSGIFGLPSSDEEKRLNVADALLAAVSKVFPAK